MHHGIIGKKVGMTQIFDADGTVVPVTVVQAGPCLVVQRRRRQGRLRGRADRPGRARARTAAPTRPRAGQFEKAGVAADADARGGSRGRGRRVEAGRQGALRHLRRAGPRRRRSASSKGKGFWASSRATASAAAPRPTARCSTGLRARSGRRRSRRASIPGTRSSGRLGGRQATTKNLVVVRVDAENNLLSSAGRGAGRAQRDREDRALELREEES